MKFSLSWLKEYLEFDNSLESLCQKLTSIGLEVESIQDQSKLLSAFEVAKILETQKHSNSDKLSICKVETGDGNILQIVCGAKNARPGIKVALAKIGSTIPSNSMVIKKAKIAGVESQGMLCSSEELDLDEYCDGIIEIDEKWDLGKKISEVFNKNDAIIEINVTPNRGDCLGIEGIARDLAASGFGIFKKQSIKKITSDLDFNLAVSNNANASCPKIAFRIIKNLNNCESPKWLKERLESVGINSISSVVDITNYVMLCLNRPMHAYDLDKIDDEINIRFAKDEEKFLSLKNEENFLDNKTLVIAGKNDVLAIAGVIGSEKSSCKKETTSILLESAIFDRKNISYSGRKFNILSDSRYRFERNIDPLSCEDGIEMASNLIKNICGGEFSTIYISENQFFSSIPRIIDFNFDKIKKITGVEVEIFETINILKNLGFEICETSHPIYKITIPSYRNDIEQDNDVVEEIIRIYGYNKIIPKKIDIKLSKQKPYTIDKIRDSLANRGISETISWSFCDSKIVENFTEINNDLFLANPISESLDYMRPNLAIGLIQSYQKNFNRSISNISLFEIGKIFIGTNINQQLNSIAILRSGMNVEKNHYNDQRNFDIFDIKKDFLNCLEILSIKESSLVISSTEAPKYYHPHRSCAVKLGKNIIGYFGEVHPKIVKKFEIKDNINICEIFIGKNLQISDEQKISPKKPYISNDIQPIYRDFAFVVDKELAVGDIIKTIENIDKNFIKTVEIFDIYFGSNLENNKKSIALKITIQPIEKSLNKEEIDDIASKVIDKISKEYNATLRQ